LNTTALHKHPYKTTKYGCPEFHYMHNSNVLATENLSVCHTMDIPNHSDKYAHLGISTDFKQVKTIATVLSTMKCFSTLEDCSKCHTVKCRNKEHSTGHFKLAVKIQRFILYSNLHLTHNCMSAVTIYP